MPEIAEVRVVAKTLKKQILNKKIEKVLVYYSGMIVGSTREFEKTLVGNSIKDITTNGKWIIFNLGDYSLLSHLRMEGKFFYQKSSESIQKHVHVVIAFEDGVDLRYQDVRKFGKMQIVKTDEVNQTECIAKLGIEPDFPKLTSYYLMSKFKNKSLPMKSALLDQSIINGLGNIYADEVLFASKINPLRKPSTVTEQECEDIVKNSSKIITRSFELGGCTIRSYTSSLGVIGHYQDELKVHTREGEPCPVCKTPIKRIKVGGRSTYYCPSCQK